MERFILINQDKTISCCGTFNNPEEIIEKEELKQYVESTKKDIVFYYGKINKETIKKYYEDCGMAIYYVDDMNFF